MIEPIQITPTALYTIIFKSGGKAELECAGFPQIIPAGFFMFITGGKIQRLVNCSEVVQIFESNSNKISP